jgi:type IV pilus assembly protein PilM
MRSPRILVLDLGAAHVGCGVFGLGPAGRLVLQQFAVESYSSDPAHDSRWSIALAQTLGGVASRSRLRGPAAVAVPGHLALTKFIKTSSVAKEKRGKIVAFEASESIPYPLEDVVWDYQVVADDGFDLEVMLAAAKFEAMQALCTAADSAGFSVERAVPSGSALWRGFRYNYPQVQGSVIVINIGARSTGLLFIEGDRFYLRTLGMAGNVVTQSIADELRLDFAAAEILKIQVLSGRSDLPPASPSRLAVERGAAAFVARLQLEITRSTVNHRRQSGAAAPTALYLTGGGALIPELAATLAEKSKLPVEWYNPLRNVDLSANARVAGAEGVAPVLADLVGLATQLVTPAAAEASLLPASLTQALAVRKRQPVFIAAAALALLVLVPPIVYFHQRASATQEQVARLDDLLMPLRSLQSRNEQNIAQIEEVTKHVAALRGAYETKANWVNFFADLQERLGKIEDVWLDKLAVDRPPIPTPQEVAEMAQRAADAAASVDGSPAASTGGDPAVDSSLLAVVRPLRMTLSGRLLDVKNPQSKVSPESLQRVKQLLAGFAGSQFITVVENERFDSTQNGLLRFDFTLVINPEKTL